MISNEIADTIKRKWAGNFFRGQRGDRMIVATFNEQVVGFLQLLCRKPTLIIDLIAVDSEHRGKGIASSMIGYASANCGRWIRMLVGTQISNTPSTRAYEKLGFRMKHAEYVVHYHGPMNMQGVENKG